MAVNADENYKKIIIRDYIVLFPFVLRFFSSNSKDANVLKSLNYYVGFFILFSFLLICLSTEMEFRRMLKNAQS